MSSTSTDTDNYICTHWTIKLTTKTVNFIPSTELHNSTTYSKDNNISIISGPILFHVSLTISSAILSSTANQVLELTTIKQYGTNIQSIGTDTDTDVLIPMLVSVHPFFTAHCCLILLCCGVILGYSSLKEGKEGRGGGVEHFILNLCVQCSISCIHCSIATFAVRCLSG